MMDSGGKTHYYIGIVAIIIAILGIGLYYFNNPKLEDGTYNATIVDKSIGEAAEMNLMIAGDGSVIPYVDSNNDEIYYFPLLINDKKSNVKVSNEIYKTYNVNDTLTLKVESGKFKLINVTSQKG